MPVLRRTVLPAKAAAFEMSRSRELAAGAEDCKATEPIAAPLA
jgi:hypothetical protein